MPQWSAESWKISATPYGKVLHNCFALSIFSGLWTPDRARAFLRAWQKKQVLKYMLFHCSPVCFQAVLREGLPKSTKNNPARKRKYSVSNPSYKTPYKILWKPTLPAAPLFPLNQNIRQERQQQLQQHIKWYAFISPAAPHPFSSKRYQRNICSPMPLSPWYRMKVSTIP